MNNYLISVVLPVYNGEKYLKESIESIIAQTYENWELIIVDDCSTDSSADISKLYASKDSRIHYYRNDTNLKLPRNLNKGFTLTKGQYLTWTSDDNRFRVNALQKMADTLEQNPDIQFVFASCRIIDDNGNPIEHISVSRRSLKRLVGMNSVGACFMYTRQVYEKIGNYDSSLIYVEDFDYWQRICAHFKAKTIGEILYEYRWHEGTLTNTLKKDVFYHNLEKTILKNKDGFGKLDFEQKYYYYSGLNRCQQNLKESWNPYKLRYMYFATMYFFRVRIPSKIKRKLKRLRWICFFVYMFW